MPRDDSFKGRSDEIRRAARERLIAMREQRRQASAKRRERAPLASAETASEAAPSTPAPTMSASPKAQALAADVRAETSSPETSPPPSDLETVGVEPVAAEIEEPQTVSLDDVETALAAAVENAATADPSPSDDAPESVIESATPAAQRTPAEATAAIVAEIAAAERGPIVSDVEDDAGALSAAFQAAADVAAQAGAPENDLASLPGVGLGMIWLLGKAGVRSRADLAVADPELLEREIGALGQVIDVRSWIAAARCDAASA